MTDIKIVRLSDKSFLQIGKEMAEIAAYDIRSREDGKTDILVAISGDSATFEMAASMVTEENNSKEENENEK